VSAWVEPPPGWGPRQVLLGRLERLGYQVDVTGAGEAWRLVLR